MQSIVVDYTYTKQPFGNTEAPGISVFHKAADGSVYHTYSVYGRGVELMMGTYRILDLTPKGRDENHLERSMEWVHYHDSYETGLTKCGCQSKEAKVRTLPAAANESRAPRLPENLPVIEAVIEPEPVKAQPEQWRCIGQEVSEQLDYEPARFLRRRTIRKIFVHRVKLDEASVIAPLPERLQDRSLPAPGLLAQILVAKYCDHLPLYRQEQIFARRHQVHLPRQTLARWVELAADWMQPIYEQIRTGVMAGGYAQVDETPVNYLEPGNGKTKQGYFWTAGCPKGDVFFRWESSRGTACSVLTNGHGGLGTAIKSPGWPQRTSRVCMRNRRRI